MSLDTRLVVGRKGERRNFPHSDTTGTNYSSNNDDSYNKMSNCEIPVKMNIVCAVSGGHGLLTESKFLGPQVSLSSTTPAYHRYLSSLIFFHFLPLNIAWHTVLLELISDVHFQHTHSDISLRDIFCPSNCFVLHFMGQFMQYPAAYRGYLYFCTFPKPAFFRVLKILFFFLFSFCSFCERGEGAESVFANLFNFYR